VNLILVPVHPNPHSFLLNTLIYIQKIPYSGRRNCKYRYNVLKGKGTIRYLDVCRGHRIGQIHDKFSKLFDVDDVLGVLRVSVNNFGTAGNLIHK
jgi:hypothetical protein